MFIAFCYFLFITFETAYAPGTKLVYVPTCAVLKSVNPHYNIQKELLSR